MAGFVSLVVGNGGRVHPETGVPMIECCELIADNPDDRVPWGECPNMGALGITAIPYPPSADAKEFAQLVVLSDVGGHVGVVVGGRDHRAGKVYGELIHGETALHATGPDFDSRVLCKDQMCSIIVGNDCLISIDRKNKVISIAGFGHTFEMSKANGILLAEKGGAGLSLNNGVAWLKGSYLLGNNPKLPPAIGPQPGLVAVGGLAE